MTPKEKAKELISKMSFSTSRQLDYSTGLLVDIPQNMFAKQCAIIAVELKMNGMNAKLGDPINYWQEVKNELEFSL